MPDECMVWLDVSIEKTILSNINIPLFLFFFYFIYVVVHCVCENPQLYDSYHGTNSNFNIQLVDIFAENEK